MFQKIRSYKSPLTGTVSKVYRDNDTGKGKVVNSTNVTHALKYLKEKRSALGEKRTSFYNEKLRRGHRLVAAIDPLVWVNHPEIWDDDEKLKKFMDNYDYWKQMDVGFTHVKHKRNFTFSQSARERLDKMFPKEVESVG
jgi:hypothetical protein